MHFLCEEKAGQPQAAASNSPLAFFFGFKLNAYVPLWRTRRTLNLNEMFLFTRFYGAYAVHRGGSGCLQS